MGEIISWVIANYQMVIGVVGTVVMGASIAVRAIAPLTATDKDDRVASWLGKVHGFLGRLALNPKK